MLGLFLISLSVSLLLQLAILFHKQHHTFKNLVQVRIDLKEWKNTVHVGHDEILLHGKLFDYKQKKIIGNHIILTGCYDNKEEDLMKANQQLWKKKVLASSLFTFLFYEPINASPLFHFVPVAQRSYLNLYTCALLHRYGRIEIPPPDRC